MKARVATTRQFLRFVVLGIINTAFSLVVYMLLILSGMLPQSALAVAFGIGVVWNFMLHRSFLFGDRGFSRLPYYIVAYIVTYCFNAVALQALLAAGLGSILAQTLLAPVAAILSFMLVSKALTGHFPPLGR